MGITLRTALIIQGNDVKVYTFSDKKSGKFGVEIGYMERDNYRLLLDTSPVFASEKEAREAGDRVINDVKAMDLGAHVKNLQDSIPEPHRDVIRKVIGGLG